MTIASFTGELMQVQEGIRLRMAHGDQDPVLVLPYGYLQTLMT